MICVQLVSLPLRDFSTNQLTGTIPPELGNLTSLSSELYAQARIVFPFDTISSICNDFCGHRCAISLLHCRSIRDFNTNQLNGTIPPELGNLPQLQRLYARNCIVLIDKSTLHLQLMSHAINFLSFLRSLCIPIVSSSFSQVPLLE